MNSINKPSNEAINTANFIYKLKGEKEITCIYL